MNIMPLTYFILQKQFVNRTPTYATTSLDIDSLFTIVISDETIDIHIDNL